ncbi:uncharacterized protein HRG_06283 [Hirsutella rhossiliensis]|uniref:SWR1-complex protein 3 domain-containing protein n=1 Tax=Hirsutella rhossiliensis TaxID=111463 RepID=A0A9P8SIN1_9HYPO|nr:uncharacterized protein HRG_06283 [Hirsutella rhossiliensis]KAH0962181.1 hypothetical protein HRG_06283 [Hirsutella rhossiliensis]
MEKKRKLPARAAARVEQAAKKRHVASRDHSSTPTPAQPVREPTPPPPPPSLPTSIQVGKPLPTVEDAQSGDLSVKEYQSISESGVLAESLSRSRHKWISEGLFEKYWTKPYKRKGVLHEDPKNPPKDSMTRVGTVTITIEPHIVEATMYAVKQPKQPLPSPPIRPVLQYGPPNGSMPPPPTRTPATNPSQPSPAPTPRRQNAASPADALKPTPGVTPRASVAPSPVASAAATPPVTASRQPSNPPPRQAVAPQTATTPLAAPGAHPPNTAAKPAANDPVIALLAQKASGDPELRDLMKRVAVGQAREGELAQFQKIIDQLNVECKQKSSQPGPSADALLVDGRTVKYFADEVRTILDIVLASNPNQKSTELRPPPRSDPLVVLLVKTALEDQRTKDMIRRIAEGRPGFTDARDLKEILDRLHRDAKTVPKGPPPPAPSHVKQPTPNGAPNGHAKTANFNTPQHETVQALRSKGPPPAAKPDISAVVFDFGSGDRYIFPKYSVLEFLPTQSGQQMIASFLIVRKGSTSEYGGDPALDYYQPVTIRLSTNTGRHLENLARVVASQEEVRRYMNDVMDNMTRAEYVLLAMRLPRAESDGDQTMLHAEEENGSTPKSESEPERVQPPKPGVLWASSSAKKPLDAPSITKLQDSEQQSQLKYERLIRSVAEKDPEAAS